MEREPGIVFFEGFIRNERESQDSQEGPGDGKCGTPKIKNEEGAQQAPEKKLQYADKPEMNCGRVLVVARLILAKIDDNDAGTNDDEVHDNPKILPKKIHPFQSDGIEYETADE